MGVHFPLGDVTSLRLEHILDRIFQSDDVLPAFRVYLLDQRRERGGLSASDRAGDENQPVLITRQQLQVFGQTQLVHRLDARVDDPEYDIDTEPLPNYTRPKPAVLIGIGKIRVSSLI